MLIVFFLLGWPLVFLAARELTARGMFVRDWRIEWTLTNIGFAVGLTAIVEVSSVFHKLNQTTVASLWAVSDVLLLIGILWLRKKRRGWPFSESAPGLQRVVARAVNEWRLWPAGAKCFLGTGAVFLAALFLIALLTPTTNVDSLSYHLARMAHWIQQESVEHYPTDDGRQLEFGPWSSFAMTTLFLLSGSDRLLNLVQWFAMLSSVIVLTWLVEEAGRICGLTRPFENPARKRLTAAFTVVVVVTIPIGALESITTQNNYTTGYWLLAFAAFLLLLLNNPTNPLHIAGCALACALGVLTKATTYMYAAPLVIAGGAWWIGKLWQDRGAGFRSKVALVLLFPLLFLAINGPHMLRNQVLFGSPLGSSDVAALVKNEFVSPGVIWSNLIRNLALHANTPVPVITSVINDILLTLHYYGGVDLHHPGTTWGGRFSFAPRTFAASDLAASCPVHCLLILAALGFLCATFGRHLRLLTLCAVLVASTLFFCAYLKWQPWHSRLHLPYFLLWVPPVVLVVMERVPKWGVHGIAMLLVLPASLAILCNGSRPVLDREFWTLARELQYLRDPGLPKLADDIVASGCMAVGLKAGQPDRDAAIGVSEEEYALWLMLRNRGFTGHVFRVCVDHPSKRIRTHRAAPCVLITHSPALLGDATNGFAHVRHYGHVKRYGVVSPRLTVFWPEKPAQTDAEHPTGSGVLARE
jgi:hypothetical protein